jgi:hypothetical protein
MIAPADFVPQMPADLRTILESDPRLDGLSNTPGEFAKPTRVLRPANPPHADEAGLVKMHFLSEDRFNHASWRNEPTDVFLPLQVGDGRGLSRLVEKPAFVERGKPLKQRADAFEYVSWLVVSGRFIEVVRRFAPQDIETREVDWTLGDGNKLADMHFLDVLRLVDAYDYQRTQIRVICDGGRHQLDALEYPRALKAGASTGVHICRDSFRRQDILVSHELAKAMMAARLRGVKFQALDTGRVMDLDGMLRA